MIYLVTNSPEMFTNEYYTIISPEDSIKIIENWNSVQYDSETTGIDAKLDRLLSMQFGNPEGDIQIVVDCNSVSPIIYKKVLENVLIIGQNLKFDLQFLYNYNIVPLKVYDTMIVEQYLHLGYPAGSISYSLKAIAERRLNVVIDKTTRGQIIWRGLDTQVILYAAGDVKYLYKIMQSQVKDLKAENNIVGAKVECDFTPAIAYLEWSGIHLDVDKWKAKMKIDNDKLQEAKKALDDYMVNYYLEHNKTGGTETLEDVDYLAGDYNWGSQKKVNIPWVQKPLQLDMFNPDPSPKCTINWNSPEVIKVFKFFGFNTKVADKQTGAIKDSIQEKVIKGQKGINNEFLKLYLTYQGAAKVVSTYGQNYIDAINPKDNRIHSVFRALGASSGRMSCGSNQTNLALSKAKAIPLKRAINGVQLQNLPADEMTRAAFTAENGNLLVDADFSALESRLGADIYNEKSMIDEFLHGSGDIHSLCAYMVYHNEIPRDTPIKDIKKLYPKLRKAVKPIEFSQQFGGSEYAIASSLGCSIEEALKFKNAYDKGFPGIAKFKQEGSKFVRNNGYVMICKTTGHRVYWHDWKEWKAEQESYTSEFWDKYRELKAGDPNCVTVEKVKQHFKAASKWDRMALNSPTQGTGAIIIKEAATNLLRWIVKNDMFGKILLCNMVHDELLVEFPENLKDSFPKLVEQIMFDAAAKYCKKVPIPAEAEMGNCWIH